MTYRYLDLTRATAAVLVLLSHSRAFFLVDYDDVAGHRSILIKGLYFLSGFGHQSVMVFFVLSGFLISGSVVKAVEGGSWTWAGYALHRWTRLFVVLAPCVVLTVGLDAVAIEWTRSAFYAGDPGTMFGSGPPRGGVSLAASTVVGNLLFLQTMVVPVLGSNGPMWSLANEFWYYVLFPLGFLAWARRRNRLEAGAYAVLGSVIAAVILTPAVLALFPVWLFGSLVVLTQRAPAVRRVTRAVPTLVACGLLFAAALTAARLEILRGPWGDALLGVAYTGLMSCLLARTGAGNPVLRVSDRIAAMSFSLYLLHFPLLAFIHAVVFHDHRAQPDALGVLTWLGVSAVVFACCAGLYALFEARTAAVRHAVSRVFARFPRTASAIEATAKADPSRAGEQAQA